MFFSLGGDHERKRRGKAGNCERYNQAEKLGLCGRPQHGKSRDYSHLLTPESERFEVKRALCVGYFSEIVWLQLGKERFHDFLFETGAAFGHLPGREAHRSIRLVRPTV